MAISIAAFSLGGSIIAPLLAFGIHHLGWRTTLILSGVLLAVIVVPFAQLLKPSPEVMGLRPDGDSLNPPSEEDHQKNEVNEEIVDFTVREALKTKSYWVLAIGTMLRTGTLGTIIVHFVPMMVWKGNSEQSAAMMLGILAFLSIPMRIGIGWLGDRWSRPKLLSAGMALGAISLLWFQNAQGLKEIWIFICVFAIVEGLSALNWALVNESLNSNNEYLAAVAIDFSSTMNRRRTLIRSNALGTVCIVLSPQRTTPAPF